MSDERDLVTGVIRLANLFNRRLGPVFEKASVTPPQWFVLSALANEGAPMSLVALGRRLAVTKQNMTGMIARLEQLGLAERHDDPTDLRSWRVSLTRRGRSIVDKLRPSYEQWIRDLLTDDVTERDLQSLTRTLERLIAQLEA